MGMIMYSKIKIKIEMNIKIKMEMDCMRNDDNESEINGKILKQKWKCDKYRNDNEYGIK